MIDVLKKTLEVGLGAAAMTQEKMKEITDELVVKGKLTEKEGGDILKDFKKIAEESQRKMKSIVEEQVHAIIKELGIATMADIKSLKGKISKLEAKVEKKGEKKEAKKK
ncbi:MAG: phasin family protein [Deltaproteobacteria bacterium]|nr:phasin family protein [Deltaproteobacteria bacterium]